MNGMKHDEGKPRPQLVLGTMAQALQAVIEVAEHGARKYSPDNWLKVPDAQARYTDAMLRHLLAELSGEARDPDSSLLHAAHAAWGALARLELMLRAKAAAAPESDAWRIKPYTIWASTPDWAMGVEEVVELASLNARLRELLPESWRKLAEQGLLDVVHRVSANQRWYSLKLRGRYPDPLFEVEAETLEMAVHMLITSPHANARRMELGL